MASLVLGIISLLFVFIGLIPFLGIMIWIAIPLMIIGVVLAIVGIVGNKKRPVNIGGIIICGICLIIGCIRLSAGHKAVKKAVEKAPKSLEKMEDTVDKLNDLSESLKNLNDSLNK